MSITTYDVQQTLLAESPEFRQLFERHSQCEIQLEQITKATYLNADDLIVETTLKKTKLRLKDEMEQWIARRRKST